MREMVGGCCVCSDDRGWSENPLVYCDGQSCNVAVHQACYGIVTVPTGPWYCRKCESQERSVKVRCELCPSKYGALKRTDNQGWAHVVCALYIPEVRFGNVTTMEPIQLQLIPPERFNKVCYICEEKGKPANATFGACMQCNKAGCKQQFHVTCAQSLGLLCEEAGNYLDNVKYCGYCQHHYSKLKKGGNVKTIPPYKPVNDSHNSDSNSEKETEAGGAGGAGAAAGAPPPPKSGGSPSSGKRKSSSSSGGKHNSTKSSSSSAAKSSSSSSGSHQKAVHGGKGGSDKAKVPNARGRGEEGPEGERREHAESDSGSRDGKGSKKRKANSRTPTPVTVVQNEVSVVVTAVPPSATSVPTVPSVTSSGSERKSAGVGENLTEKPKKPKVDSTQSIIINQPVVALTSISTTKATSPSVAVGDPASAPAAHPPLPPAAAAVSIIQTAQAPPPPPPPPPPQQQQHPSLLVSVPLAGTSLSPRHIVNNQTSVLTPTPSVAVAAGSERTGGQAERGAPLAENIMMPGGGGGGSAGSGGVLTSEMSGGGLKITYERQPDSINTEEDMELELEPTPPTSAEDVPAKRGRSHSNDKTERHSRGRKRNSNSNGVSSTPPATSNTLPKRSSRSQSQRPVTPPPQPGAFAAISQAQIKDSPPSSPSSESLGATSCSSRSRTKGRKSAPAAVNMNSGSSKDSKDVKLFQNGVTAAPHMLGNQLNPNSNMHQKMTDHLSSELEAHSIYNPNEVNTNLVGPQMHHRVIQSARASSSGSSTASGSGISSVLGGGSGTIPQTLDQLLERQWEQGSQFLMEQAQHFDIASLLSCLHQLRAENLRLEEHVGSLLQRRDHLLAVNARLAIPLTNQPAAAQPPHPHTVNNIHPSLTTNHADIPRSSRHSNNSNYDRHADMSSRYPPVENGLPPESYPQNPHRRSPAGGQPSPTIRW